MDIPISGVMRPDCIAELEKALEACKADGWIPQGAIELHKPVELGLGVWTVDANDE